MNYWAVGHSFGRNKDVSKDFFDKSYWFDGYADNGINRNKIHLDKIAVGDMLIMKSSFTKGTKHDITCTRIKAIGIITEKENDYTFKVNWFSKKRQDFEGVSYRKTLEPMRSDAMLDFAKKEYTKIINSKQMQNYQSILNQKPQIILQGAPGTGKTRLAEDLAYHMIFGKALPTDKAERDEALKELYNSEQFALVQFHPAYSYEDFVRGIVAETKDNAISYEVKNKILVEMSERANKNLLDSQKELTELQKELQIEEYLEKFKDDVQNKIDVNKKFAVNDTVYIEAVGEEGFYYTGDNWANTLNMKYKDILLFHQAGVIERKMIKKLKGVSGTAINHASYYFKLFQKFQEYVEQNKGIANVYITEKTKLKNYILIIDEINRANLPAVLGELIYALEYRDKPVNGLYELDGDRQITLPKNLYIIGTMNTADRSVGHIDYAIRRRFAFVDVLPDKEVVSDVAKSLFKTICGLFIKNYDAYNAKDEKPTLERSEHLAPDFRPEDIMIGHSYFIVADETELKTRLQYEIKPLLKEYLKDGILLESARSIIEDLRM